jgi:hypothetical protein
VGTSNNELPCKGWSTVGSTTLSIMSQASRPVPPVPGAATDASPAEDTDQPSLVASATGLTLTRTARMFQTMKHRLSVIQRKLQEVTVSVARCRSCRGYCLICVRIARSQEEIHEEEEVLQLLRRDLDDVRRIVVWFCLPSCFCLHRFIAPRLTWKSSGGMWIITN